MPPNERKGGGGKPPPEPEPDEDELDEVEEEPAEEVLAVVVLGDPPALPRHPPRAAEPLPPPKDSAAACEERFRSALRAAGVGFPMDRLALLERLRKTGASVLWREGEPEIPLYEIAGLFQGSVFHSEADFLTIFRSYLGRWSQGRPAPPITSAHHGHKHHGRT